MPQTRRTISRERAPFFASERTTDDQYATIIWKRRMTITDQERLLGLTPEGVQDGDLICIISGCSVPVVLRKIVSDEMTGEHHYELAGDCYVHGMIDDEASTMQQTKEYQKPSLAIARVPCSYLDHEALILSNAGD